MIQDLLDHVRSLPPLPASAERLLSAADDPDVNIRKLAPIVAQDQALTARILKVANSAFYGFPQQVTTVSQAMVILGLQSVRNIALSVALLSMQQEEDGVRRGRLEQLWWHAIAVASAARKLAAGTRRIHPEQAFVSGLLHDVGKVVLVKGLGEEYERLLERAEAGAAPLHVLEREALGTDHAAVGQALCAYWNIPPALTHIVAAHHGPVAGEEDPLSAEGDELLLRTVRSANALAKIAAMGGSGNTFVDTDAVGPRSPLPHEHLERVLAGLPDQVQAIGSALYSGAEVLPEGCGREAGPVIGTYLQHPGTEAAIALLLGARRRPVLSEGSEGGEDLVCVIAEGPLSPDHEAALGRRGVPVGQVASWTGGSSGAEGPSLWIDGIRNWLSHEVSRIPLDQ